MSSEAKESPDDKAWQEWRRQFSDVYWEIRGLVQADHVFIESMNCLETWPQWRWRENITYAWLASMYMRDAIVGIRKQLDRRSDVHSLWRLLDSISRTPRVISRERFLRFFGEDGSLCFDRWIGASEHLDGATVENDLGSLEGAWKSSGLQGAAHERIAHWARSSSAPTEFEWKLIHDFIERIEAICLKYSRILFCSDCPPILGYDNPVVLRDVSSVRPEIRSFWTGEVQRSLGLHWSEASPRHPRVELSPDVLLGKPVVRGTRIPVELVVRKLSEGATEEALLDGYPKLAREDIRACLAYAADSLAHETIFKTKPV